MSTAKATSNWQLTIFDALTAALKVPGQVDSVMHGQTIPAATVKPTATQLTKDPLINKVIPIPEFPANVLRREDDKNDLVYNLRHIN